eukprot:gene38217-50122_t
MSFLTLKGPIVSSPHQIISTRVLCESAGGNSEHEKEDVEVELQTLWRLKQCPSLSKSNLRLDSVYLQSASLAGLANETLIIDLSADKSRNVS